MPMQSTGPRRHIESDPTPSSRLPSGKVAYIMSAFPTLTETFILYEILAMEDLGVQVEVYPLRRLREPIVHAEVAQVMDRVHYRQFLSFSILLTQWHFIRRSPLAYFRVLAEVLWGTLGSWRFFLKACAIFPKSVQFACDMERQGVRHVHAHFATHPTVAALIVHRLTGIPFSFTAHGSDLHVDRRMLDEKVAAAEFVLTVSSFNKEVIVQECGEDVRGKVHVMHCGVDGKDFPNTPRNGADGRSLHILCVAAFKDVKGHKYLVEACHLLRQRCVNFVCHLVGEGPERPRVEAQIAALNLQDRILVHGARPRDEIIEMLGKADVFALASVPTRRGKREGIPVVLMEAMSCGLPVVASRLSGIPELVDHEESGLLVSPRDVVALADALERLNANPSQRHAMGQSGRAKVLREFNLRRNSARRAALYHEDSSSLAGMAN